MAARLISVPVSVEDGKVVMGNFTRTAEKTTH
jgi:hypothetical protein